VILLAVCRCLRYGLSYRDVEELLAERGIEVDHVTIYRWVQRFTPVLIDASRPCRHSVSDRWLVDETYVKVTGVWRYVYEAVAQHGQVIDVFVSKRRNLGAARHFFRDCCVDGSGPSVKRVSVSRRSLGVSTSFAGYRFPAEVILLAVRWYLRYGLSYRDVEELLAERGIEVDHVTIYGWVQRFTPELINAARPCGHSVGDRWFVDETYVKVAGIWRYVYRAVDQHGQVIDVYVSKRRNLGAARVFFESVISAHGRPTEVTTDLAAPLLRVVDELLPEVVHETEQYANNRIENDHGRLKARLRPMRGLRTDRTASVVIRGHAFMQNLRRGHYELGLDASEECLRVAAAFDELADVI